MAVENINLLLKRIDEIAEKTNSVIRCKNDQLNKAVEILKRMISLIDFLNGANERAPVVIKAEKFLKEVKK